MAQLSNLALGDQEVEDLRNDIDNILGYVEQLNELDTAGVEPTYQVTDLENVFRTDEVDDYGISREKLISLAPKAQANQIEVPKVL